MSQSDRSDSRQQRSKRLRMRLFMILGGIAVIAVCLLVRSQLRPAEASAQAPSPQPAAQQNVVAVVNGEEISRNELGQQCLWHYGEEVLESIVNRQLIQDHCAKSGINVSAEEVQQEISRVAANFGLPIDQWLQLLRDERQIGPQQYADEIVWPKLALEKLAAPKLQVTPQEIQEAYELQYGPSVQCRIIVCADRAQIEEARAAAVANPDDFGNLAKRVSVDYSAASKGLVQPIRRHMGDEAIERAAFALRPGEISPVIEVHSQFAILKCERHFPAVGAPLEDVREQLVQAIRDRKLTDEADRLLSALQEQARVENVLNDPAKREQHPGVAAFVNGQPITIRELAEACIERHGVEVLSGTINHRLLSQECRRNEVTVSQQDIDREIERAARAMGKTTQQWFEELDAQGVNRELYIHDSVWPSAALKKLVGDVQVTAEDLQKGYEANYGPRVRCLAIVFNNQRRANEVYMMARDNPTPEYFGDLAAEYSIEPSSRALRGEVPPIQQHGGQPSLEAEAFALQPNELSGIVQVDDKFVLLFCLGRTSPTQVAMEEVRDEIHADLHEKKLRVAMAEEFSRLQSAATIDNYLANTSQTPTRSRTGATNPVVPASALTPSSATPARRPAVRP